MRVRVYVEGGGRDKTVGSSCRRAFHELFKKLDLERQPKVIAAGGRDDVFKRFVLALASYPDDYCLLLVDSEGPVVGRSAWRHLENQAGWSRPARADDGQAHLMVQCTESWLLADRDALSSHCGKGFVMGALPKRADLEAIPKSDVLRGLSRATARTRAGALTKGQRTFDLLAAVEPKPIRAASPFADRFFAELERLMG